MPSPFSQRATWAMFLSSVRPDNISSPITTSAAVQILDWSATRASGDTERPNAYLGSMTQYITVADDDRVEAKNGVIKLHGPEGFAGMRAAGRLAAEILDALVPHVVPGVTTEEIDFIVNRLMTEAGAVPATLGYRGYTKSCCTSINHVVCHGIPGDKALKDG